MTKVAARLLLKASELTVRLRSGAELTDEQYSRIAIESHALLVELKAQLVAINADRNAVEDARDAILGGWSYLDRGRWQGVR